MSLISPRNISHISFRLRVYAELRKLANLTPYIVSFSHILNCESVTAYLTPIGNINARCYYYFLTFLKIIINSSCLYQLPDWDNIVPFKDSTYSQKMTENAAGYSVTTEIICMPRNIRVPNQAENFTMCLFSIRKEANLSLSTKWRQTGRAELQLYSFLTSELHESLVNVSPSNFTPRKQPRTQSIFDVYSMKSCIEWKVCVNIRLTVALWATHVH